MLCLPVAILPDLSTSSGARRVSSCQLFLCQRLSSPILKSTDIRTCTCTTATPCIDSRLGVWFPTATRVVFICKGVAFVHLCIPDSICQALVLHIKRKRSWSCRQCQVDLTGKTAIVTGANTGIGKMVAMDLARRNARVILACRSRDRGQTALQEIREQTRSKNVSLSILDTSSMSSVRAFAEHVLQEEKRLDILVNNAGVSGLPHSITSEGFELTYATNHLGPFLLTNLLLDLMKSSSPGRIVFVSSVMHKMGFINIKHLKGDDLSGHHVSNSYNCTKLMNVACATELARRLQGSGVTVNSLHPGIVMTEAMRNYNVFLRFLFSFIGFFFFKTAEDGAASTLFCAVSEEMEGVTGKYIDSDCTMTLPSDKARDLALAKKLWEASELVTGQNSST